MLSVVSVQGQMRPSDSLSQEFGEQMGKGALLETPFPVPRHANRQKIHTGTQSPAPSGHHTVHPVISTAHSCPAVLL